jgi:hypothetical protein
MQAEKSKIGGTGSVKSSCEGSVVQKVDCAVSIAMSSPDAGKLT